MALPSLSPLLMALPFPSALLWAHPTRRYRIGARPAHFAGGLLGRGWPRNRIWGDGKPSNVGSDPGLRGEAQIPSWRVLLIVAGRPPVGRRSAGGSACCGSARDHCPKGKWEKPFQGSPGRRASRGGHSYALWIPKHRGASLIESGKNRSPNRGIAARRAAIWLSPALS